jgi:transcriptional regulator GlxA family with amidase domain
MRLLDRSAAEPVLHALLVRELHYWLLAGRHEAAKRPLIISWPERHAQRVARAVAVLRAEFARPLPVERLAAVAGMIPSSFHRHFHAVTSLSPLQFQKQLRCITCEVIFRVHLGPRPPAPGTSPGEPTAK